jgi:hypothetical protein
MCILRSLLSGRFSLPKRNSKPFRVPVSYTVKLYTAYFLENPRRKTVAMGVWSALFANRNWPQFCFGQSYYSLDLPEIFSLHNLFRLYDYYKSQYQQVVYFSLFFM